MPNEYQAAVDFYETYYRPNNAILVVAGDVEPQRVFDLAERYYGDWERHPVPEQPDPGPVEGPKREHVEWEVPVPPRATVAYKMPAHATGSVETAVGQLLPELLAGETAPLYTRLRYEQGLVQGMGVGKAVYESFDDGHLDVGMVLYQDKMAELGAAYYDRVVTEVQDAMSELASFSSQEGAPQRLEALKSKYRYDLLATLDSPANTASQFVLYYRFERDPEVMDRLAASVEALTPGDIERFAARYLVPENRVVVTMDGPDAGTEGEGGSR